jgi:hypothetical protein
MSDALVGLIRTWVPAGVGAVLAWLVTLGVELDPQTEAGLLTSLTALSIAVYYTLVRLLEAKWPAVGVLLGVPKTAHYGRSVGTQVSGDKPVDGTDWRGSV